ncbi:MAG: hypothetical protein QME96_16040 [Myxococcota bacterium]|nr:hypothetical protein [Myxococcota bacterium]
MHRFLAAAVFAVSIAAPAAAQEPPPIPSAEFVFPDELVDTTLLRPEHDRILRERRRPTTSLIRIRHAFVNELLKAAENL